MSSLRQQALHPWSTQAVNILTSPVVYTGAPIEIGIWGAALRSQAAILSELCKDWGEW